MSQSKQLGRRSFLNGAAAVSAGLLSLSGSETFADDTFSMSAGTTGKCGTCKFWGGVRKVSKDGKSVTFESQAATGWCNNPESGNYHQRTAPETGPMPMWRKWSVLA